MYTIDKLIRFCETNDHSINNELSYYFIKNLHRINTLTLSKCIKESNVSKASIHRFYSKAGFINFKDFINVLEEEYNEHIIIDYIRKWDLEELSIKIKNAHTICIYGNNEDIHLLRLTQYYCLHHQILLLNINYWDISSIYKQIELLNDNDLLIILDTTLSFNSFKEMAMNRKYLLNVNEINNKVHKYFIGNNDISKDNEFNIININTKDIIDFDKTLFSYLRED